MQTQLLIELTQLADSISSSEAAFQMRRRLNPHHSKDQVKIEHGLYMRDQKEKFFRLKALYCESREDLLKQAAYIRDTIGDETFYARAIAWMKQMDEVIDKEAYEALESHIAED